MARVIGVDQSYTGFGYSVDGVAKKKAFPLSKYTNEVERLIGIRDWLRSWVDTEDEPSNGGVDLVVMEGYAPGSKFGREVAGELGGIVKLAVWEVMEQAPLIVPPPSLKKFVTGKGNAKKNEMLLGVYKQWGESFSDDNQADAYALEQFGKAYLQHFGVNAQVTTPPVKLHKYQIEAIEAVRKAK